METEEIEIDERMEPLKKLIELGNEREQKEAEYREYIRQNNNQQRVIAQSVMEMDIQKYGHVTPEIKDMLKSLGIAMEDDKVAAGGIGVHTEEYKGFVVTSSADLKPRVVYGKDIDAVLDAAEEIMLKSGLYDRVNIGSLNKMEGTYGGFRKFDIAQRKDVSRIYLTLPRLERDEFMRLIGSLKENGARFDGNSKRWYVRADAKLEPFREYIAEAVPAQRDYSRARFYTSQELELSVSDGEKQCKVKDLVNRRDGVVTITYNTGDNRPSAAFYKGSTKEAAREAALTDWLSNPERRTIFISGHEEYIKDLCCQGKGYSLTDKAEQEKIIGKTGTGYPGVSIVREGGNGLPEHYAIYGIHDMSGEMYKMSARNYDTKEQAERNIPKKHKLVELDELKEAHADFKKLVKEMITDDIEQTGFKATDGLISSIKMLNHISNKMYTVREIAELYQNAEKTEGLPSAEKDYIKQIGNEFAEMEQALKVNEVHLPEA